MNAYFCILSSFKEGGYEGRGCYVVVLRVFDFYLKWNVTIPNTRQYERGKNRDKDKDKKKHNQKDDSPQKTEMHETRLTRSRANSVSTDTEEERSPPLKQKCDVEKDKSKPPKPKWVSTLQKRFSKILVLKLFDGMTWNFVGWYFELLGMFSDLRCAVCMLIFKVVHTCTDPQKWMWKILLIHLTEWREIR